MGYLCLGLLIIIFLGLLIWIVRSFANKKKEEGISNILLMTGFSLITTSFRTIMVFP